MDNISHALFGASIVQAGRGKRYGAKVGIYALIASNIPDIDLALRFIPGIDPLIASFFHRTATHSFVFAFVAAAIMGRIMSRATKSGSIGRKDRGAITLVSILSHIFLDRCTTYGVRLLWPFSSVGFEGRMISVIDLFFTLPLLALVVWALVKSRKKKKEGYTHSRWVRYLPVTYAFCYLIGMTAIQQNLQASLRHDMDQAGVQYTRTFAAPQMLQPFLRYGMVELPDGSYKATYTSIFDTKPRTYENIYGYHDRGEALARTDGRIASLIRRSHGRYQMDSDNQQFVFRDLRFGRMLGRDAQNRGTATFSYYINATQQPAVIGQHPPAFPLPFAQVRKKYRERVRGN